MSTDSTLCQRLSRKFPRLSLLVAMITALARSGERALRPGQRAWRGAANGLAAVTLLLFVSLVFYGALLPTPSVGRVVAIGERLAQAVGAGLGVLLAAWALLTGC